MRRTFLSLSCAVLLLSPSACSFSFQASAGSKTSTSPSGKRTGKPAKPPKKTGPKKKALPKGNGASGGGGGNQAPPPDRAPEDGPARAGQGGTTLTNRPAPDEPENLKDVTNRAAGDNSQGRPTDVTARPAPKTPPPTKTSVLKAPD